MTCTVCHDPHSATLKTVQGQEDIGPSALCINCHSEVSMAFPYSKHNQAGVSCVECHLRHFEPGTTDVHAIPDHSFTASIATCSACHADQMHAQPTEDATTAQIHTNHPDRKHAYSRRGWQQPITSQPAWICRTGRFDRPGRWDGSPALVGKRLPQNK